MCVVLCLLLIRTKRSSHFLVVKVVNRHFFVGDTRVTGDLLRIQGFLLIVSNTVSYYLLPLL
jgi:hypothetical protein